ncbi:hypothetical protein [Cupriavidus sp.]|uniref:hypothetical protein n=1 Tax=Cupriavidus sp. TaxID=1873897 RepID=UPI0025BB1D26|nr:hypothetical protein [Cupriavidus sp.]MCA3185975.1 hypothetical protein [Cupriavidus sp.]MCA3193589.1 hypothetical protein [Cupriavidus sp.]MCA3199979.1 hypothetical protein [Cupriavidus sp.]MCA3201992.1 hypothetical protein [Cupriavidus sp.]MCA3235418.1 hypothetical protein [Cupriavidus sp.]
MDEGVALRIARSAVQQAMKKHGDNKQRAFRELQEMAKADAQLNEAFTKTGWLELKAEQSVKH